MAKPKMKLLICKSESCLSCIHKVTDRVSTGEGDEDELEVICDLEMDANEDDELEVCPQYSAIAPQGEEYIGENYRVQNVVRKNYERTQGKPGDRNEDTEIMSNKTAQYIFVGDSLSQVDKKRNTSIELPVDFASNYNRRVQETKSALEQEIEQLRGASQTFLDDIQEKIKSGGIDTDDPSSLDDLFDPADDEDLLEDDDEMGDFDDDDDEDEG